VRAGFQRDPSANYEGFPVAIHPKAGSTCVLWPYPPLTRSLQMCGIRLQLHYEPIVADLFDPLGVFVAEHVRNGDNVNQ